MSLYEKLRNKYPDFFYRDYKISETENEINVSYFFEIEGLASFEPKWTFKKYSDEEFSTNETFKNMVFSLGMVELVSYWKLTCSPTVHIPLHKLSDKEISFWKELYFGGLGEFFYVNSITPSKHDFMTIESTGPAFKKESTPRALDGYLVAIGGGKDSAVSLEILSSKKEKVAPFIINPRGATEHTCDVAGYAEKKHVLKRVLDKKLLELNAQGFLNGHTPFSAIVAFSSLIDAYLSGKKYIVLSNESSANESTVKDSDINHQFSKGIGFETEFRKYEKEYLNTGISYFSLLRPLSEFQIAMLFSKYKKYHPIFKSCNVGSKADIWCGACPKCLFVYIILSPFLDESELIEIFGSNLFEKEELLESFKKLTGELPDKPFECVGSRDEILSALALTLEKYKGKNKPLLLSHFENRGVVVDNPRKYFSFFDEENFIPDDLLTLLKNELTKGNKYVF